MYKFQFYSGVLFAYGDLPFHHKQSLPFYNSVSQISDLRSYPNGCEPNNQITYAEATFYFSLDLKPYLKIQNTYQMLLTLKHN